jgi:DNA polymerase alpha subunit A
MPEEYTNFDSLPHVIVADRMKKQGKSETELRGHTIEFVICLPTSGDTSNMKNLANKAFSPDELKGNLRIDIDWYCSQQLLPPITRLIEHIDGIEVEFVAQCLGMDPKKYKFVNKQDDENDQPDQIVPSAVLKTETFKNLEDRTASKLWVVCPNCYEKYCFPGVVSRENAAVSGMLCKCKAPLPLDYLKNRVKFAIKQIINDYYRGKKKLSFLT